MHQPFNQGKPKPTIAYHSNFLINHHQQTEWIEKFEVCIKFHQSKPKKGPAPKPPTAQLQQQKSLVETRSIASDLTMSPDSQSVKINWGPDWLLMAPEEILAMIAQRHFEDSLAMIVKCEEYFARDSTFHNSVEIIDKVGVVFEHCIFLVGLFIRFTTILNRSSS